MHIPVDNTEKTIRYNQEKSRLTQENLALILYVIKPMANLF